MIEANKVLQQPLEAKADAPRADYPCRGNHMVALRTTLEIGGKHRSQQQEFWYPDVSKRSCRDSPIRLNDVIAGSLEASIPRVEKTPCGGGLEAVRRDRSLNAITGQLGGQTGH